MVREIEVKVISGAPGEYKSAKLPMLIARTAMIPPMIPPIHTPMLAPAFGASKLSEVCPAVASGTDTTLRTAARKPGTLLGLITAVIAEATIMTEFLRFVIYHLHLSSLRVLNKPK